MVLYEMSGEVPGQMRGKQINEDGLPDAFLAPECGEKVVRWDWIRTPGETQRQGEGRVPLLVVQTVP